MKSMIKKNTFLSKLDSSFLFFLTHSIVNFQFQTTNKIFLPQHFYIYMLCNNVQFFSWLLNNEVRHLTTRIEWFEITLIKYREHICQINLINHFQALNEIRYRFSTSSETRVFLVLHLYACIIYVPLLHISRWLSHAIVKCGSHNFMFCFAAIPYFYFFWQYYIIPSIPTENIRKDYLFVLQCWSNF